MPHLKYMTRGSLEKIYSNFFGVTYNWQRKNKRTELLKERLNPLLCSFIPLVSFTYKIFIKEGESYPVKRGYRVSTVICRLWTKRLRFRV